MPPRERDTPLINFRVDETRFKGQVRRIDGKFKQANRAFERLNKRALQWLMVQAAENLEARIRREPDPRHGRLVDMILNEEASAYNQDGFRFLIFERVERLDQRIAAYYRAIEFGTDYWVKKTNARGLALAFHGDPEHPTRGVAPTQAGFVRSSDEVIAGGFGVVRITQPVPEYEYGRSAMDSFRRSGLYTKWAIKELERVGIPVELGSRPRAKKKP